MEDNTGLNAALEQSEEVIPCFIFDPEQQKGDYFSENAFQFMCESLIELDKKLQENGSKLYVFKGDPAFILDNLFKQKNIGAVFVNRDYTPFSIARDRRLSETCKRHGIFFKQFADYLLCEPEHVLKEDGKPYTVFAHFYKAAQRIGVRKPDRKRKSNFYSGRIGLESGFPQFKINPEIFAHGGRQKALGILSSLYALGNYHETRNIPAINGTSGLSAHHKFGTISIRESYWAIANQLGDKHPLIGEIYWRDFFTYIGFYFPHVFGQPFKPRYKNLRWNSNPALLEAWKKGQTGFPIVDAGMRQLNRTGFMHNRVRMIVASFLVKDLHIDWREGERYFATKLVDYDPSVNNGNWQWCASTGCDSQPYFRIFNPWAQQKKYDPDCLYIKRWVPELSSISPEHMHVPEKLQNVRPKDYPSPIVDHSRQAAIAKEIFKVR